MAESGHGGYPLSTALDDVTFLDHSLAESDYILHQHQANHQQQQLLHSVQQPFVDNYHHQQQMQQQPFAPHQHVHDYKLQQQKMSSSPATSAPPPSSKHSSDLRSKFLSSTAAPSAAALRKINNSSTSSWTPSSSGVSTSAHHGHTSSLCATGHGASNLGPPPPSSLSTFSSNNSGHQPAIPNTGLPTSSQPQNSSSVSRNHNLKLAEIQKSLQSARPGAPSCIIPSFTNDGLKREIAKLSNERDAILQEYQLVMSERDNVHAEIERLNENLNEATGRLRSSSEEMNRLKRELATSQAEKDRYKQELQELKDRYGADFAMSYLLGDDHSQSLTSDPALFHVPGMRTSISRAINNSSVMNNNIVQGLTKGSSGDLLRHQYLSTSSSNSSVVGIGVPKGQQGYNSNYTCDNLDGASYEIDQLRRSLNHLQKELAEAQNEAEVSKRRRDWAVSEKKKMILERESIRYLCDSLRKERNTRDRELSKALTDNDELKRQVKELSRQLNELKDKLEESNRLEKENQNNCSRDSAIDTDEQVGGAIGGQLDNVVRAVGGNPELANQNEEHPMMAMPGLGHQVSKLTSSESELIELSMKNHSISDQVDRSGHRPESRLTDPRFTTIDPIMHSQEKDNRFENRGSDVHRSDAHRVNPPKFQWLASEPASRPPSVAGDPFDPWTGSAPESSSYISAHHSGGHLTPGHIQGSNSGHHTPAGILTPGGHLTPRYSNSKQTSDEYLEEEEEEVPKPKPGEVRDILVEKSNEPLGISIWVDEKKTGSIFVSSVKENSPAAKAGLHVGDQLLDVNGLNLRCAMTSKIVQTAKTVLHRSTISGDELIMKVQYNLDKFENLSPNIEQEVLIHDHDVLGNLGDNIHDDF